VLHVVFVHPTLQPLQILSPIEVGIHEVLVSISRTTGELVEEREIVRADERELDDGQEAERAQQHA
jgi:hypothetical protein